MLLFYSFVIPYIYIVVASLVTLCATGGGETCRLVSYPLDAGKACLRALRIYECPAVAKVIGT